MPLSIDIVENSSVPYDKNQLKLSDGGGLYLLVKGSGRYWKLAYRFEGKQKSLALGVYPTVGLDEARLKRDEAKVFLKQGIDPSLIKKQQKAELNNTSYQTTAELPFVKVQEQVTATPQIYTALAQSKGTDIEQRRLAILQILAKVNGYHINEKELQQKLDSLGFRVSFDRIRTDIAWLYEQQVIDMDRASVWLIHLTQTGLDVVDSRCWIPGIQQPEQPK